MKRLAALPRTVLMYAALVVLGVVSLGWNLLAVPLYRLLPEDTGRAVGRAAISRIYRGFWALATATGLLRLDRGALDALRDEPGLIVVANHPTLLDALLLVARLPKSACIMKAELMHNPFLGTGARLARYIRNDTPRAMVRSAVADLRAGGQLVVFPEGTRTVQPPTDAFRPGVALIAKLARVPIQTVFIETGTPYLRKGWPLWRPPPLPLTFTLRLGKRFAPQDDHEALLRALERYYAAALAPDAVRAAAVETPSATAAGGGATVGPRAGSRNSRPGPLSSVGPWHGGNRR